VLLGETGADNQRLIAAILEVRGLNVDPAQNGPSRRCANGTAFDLILMDYRCTFWTDTPTPD